MYQKLLQTWIRKRLRNHILREKALDWKSEEQDLGFLIYLFIFLRCIRYMILIPFGNSRVEVPINAGEFFENAVQ